MVTVNGSDDEVGSTLFDDMAGYFYLVIRLVAASVVVWYASFSSRYGTR